MKARIWNISGWVKETDPEKLKIYYNKLLKLSGFGVLSFSDFHFNPHGYSAIWLLAESHFAIHTFPEEGSSYIELSSCVEELFNKFVEHEKLNISESRCTAPDCKSPFKRCCCKA